MDNRSNQSDIRYVTTAIPYVNARPHVGFALEAVLADACARHHRSRGRDVRFLTGTDENSLKNVWAAEREGLPTEVLVARNAASFRALREVLALSFDDFLRTGADPRHAAGVRRLWERCAARGDVYKRAYRGLYCVGCEQFYAESELRDGRCPEHETTPELVEEENYFFRLSRYQDALTDLVASGRLRIEPAHRRNEVLAWLADGLQDFSISRAAARARGWGLPVPGDESQVIYVWFDALGNYVTALDYATEGALYQRYWAGDGERLHVIGKGITRFHALYWPAILLSAGAPLPTTLLVHGYLTAARRKLSKSLGNAVDPAAVVARYGTDALRYYLLRHFRPGEDGDFREDALVRAHDGELADQLGNLVHRTVSMAHRYLGGVVPAPREEREVDARLRVAAEELGAQVDRAMEALAPHDALFAIWRVVDQANRYVDETAPWSLARRARDGGDGAATAQRRLETVLHHLLETVRLVAHHCEAFVPDGAARIRGQLGLGTASEGSADSAGAAWGGLRAGTQLRQATVLFPRLEARA